MLDYIIVGAGLAGISFSEIALRNSKSILVIDNDATSSSKVAAGLYNPVILKRFTAVPNANEHLVLMNEFLTNVQKTIGAQVDYRIPILRKFFSIEEQNNWFLALDKITLSPFLSPELVTEKYCAVDSPFDFGEVLQTGFVNAPVLVEMFQDYLKLNNFFLDDTFDHSLLRIEPEFIRYRSYHAKNIVFAEGYGLLANPYFNYLPLDGTKGELLTIKAPDLKLDVIINTSIFILPLGNDIYKVGATYNWFDKSPEITAAGKSELISKVKEVINCDFEVLNQLAGIRPTVKDRKPLVGTHFKYKPVHILNGLGTRGVMLAPAMSKALFDKIELNIALDKTIDISRYQKLH